MRILVSVRDENEAAVAAEAGVDFIDLKEPSAGALGGLSPHVIRRILRALGRRGGGAQVSATIGDVPVEAAAAILARVAEVADCGVDLVKVGVPGQGGAAALQLIDRLSRCGCPLVPVLIADHGWSDEFVAEVLARPFAAVMLDTQAKGAGSLLAMQTSARLAAFLDSARAQRLPAGLAGALRLPELPRLRALAPDFAGFRSAVCAGARTAALDAELLQALLAAARGTAAAPA